MTTTRLILLAHLILLAGVHTVHGALPQRFSQDDVVPPIEGLLAADVGEIIWSGRYLWVATEGGLARLDPLQSTGTNQEDWVTFDTTHGLARGGITAIAASGDTVWIATLTDTVRAGAAVEVGQGLSLSVDGGASWETIPNTQIFNPTVPGFARGLETLLENP